MPDECLFTVFTPTYNRAHTLYRVYDSLVSQTFRDFEWLVVDDGSTDGTKTLVSDWCEEADFPIRYLYQPNQGKHVAYNHAVPNARGTLFLTLDSDDSCVPYALEALKHFWETIPQEKRMEFSGISVPCVDESGKVVGNWFEDSVTDSDYLSCYYRWKLRREKFEFQRTDVMMQYPFPVPSKRMTHIPEGVVWSRISRKYKTRYVNEPLLRYFVSEGSLCGSRSVRKNAYTSLVFCGVALNEHLDHMRYAPKDFIRYAVNYVRLSLHVRESAFRKVRKLRKGRAKIMCLLLIPVALIYYLNDLGSEGWREKAWRRSR